MAHLRYFTDDKPGYTRKKARAKGGFHFFDTRGKRITDDGGNQAHPFPGDPPGVHGRVDLPQPARAHASHRTRRAGPQTVPLPSALARNGRRQQIRTRDGLRGGAAGHPPAGGRRPGQKRVAARKSPRHGGQAARDDADPRRQRGIRAHEQALRADDAAQPARAREERDHRVFLSRQERRRSRHRAAQSRSWRASLRSARKCPGTSFFSTSTTTTSGTPWIPRT